MYGRGRAANQRTSVAAGGGPTHRAAIADGGSGVGPVVTLAAVADPSTISIRPAQLGDADVIRAIYNYEVRHETSTFDLVPRTLEDQRAWLQARSGAFSAVVAVDEHRTVVGFAALSRYKDRAAYSTTVEDSVYVDRQRGGQGIGRALLVHLVELARMSGFHAVMARIEASGTASRALHQRCGFELVGVEREVGRKFNRWLDVAVMQCLLDPPARPG